MVQRALKPCKYLGCKVLHRNQGLYCDEHQSIIESSKLAESNKRRLVRNRKYGYNMNDEDKFYSSGAWQHKRSLMKELHSYLCLNCLDNEIYQECKHVHHIVELLEDWSLRLDEDNLICLCTECHKGVHIMYRRSDKDRRDVQLELRRILRIYNEGGYKIGKRS